MSNRHTRYQGAIIRSHHILLIKHLEHDSGRSDWVFPGGGIEPGETEEECVKREMKEETNLEVQVISLLLDEPVGPEDPAYSKLKNYKTYYCEPLAGEASPGIEPEPEVVGHYSIVEVKWYDLRDETTWDSDLVTDALIYLPLQRLWRRLGYLP